MRGLTALFIAALLIFAVAVVPGYFPEKTAVVIIGAGAAGMQAAVECRQYTGSLILLEKMPYAGGNSARASGGLNAAVSDGDIPVYQAETIAAGRGAGRKELIRIMVEGSSSVLDELRGFGADLSDRGFLAGHSVSRTFRPSGGAPVGKEVTGVLYNKVRELGIDLRVENRATGIRRDGSAFIVDVENRTGRTYRIRAGAVVIATGGFGGNPEMVVRYNPELKGFNTTNSAGASGDYLRLTRDLPVRIMNMGDIQTHPTVEPDFGILITEALRGNGGILLNRQGRRFTNEMDFRESLSRKVLKQQDGFAWLIFDQGVRESLASSEYYFSMQLVRASDTLEGLAYQLPVSADSLSESVWQWNESVEAGLDPDFGRRDLLRPLENPPYYAIKVAPGVHYTMGGLAIDSSARVLDAEGRAVEGLYAAGEATGGIHGRDRLGGNSLTDAMVFGRIAGREAANWSLNNR